MDEITNTFTVPALWLHRRFHRMLQVCGTLNASKIGRTRRSGWMLTGVSADINDNGMAVVSVRMQKAPRKAICATHKNSSGIRRVKFDLYGHGDIKKVLKDLAVAEKKALVTP